MLNFKNCKLKKRFILFPVTLVLWVLLTSWGFTGHQKITVGAGPKIEMLFGQTNEWTKLIADHSGDADRRKSWDKNEGIKHYIDLDNYSEFNQNGSINQVYDTLVARYGKAFVNDQGTLPWATMAAFDSVVACFIRSDFDKAVLFAADLSHYVADGHMPLHLTRNYDGQFSGNKGIHSRYESSMISRYINQIYFEDIQVEKVENVDDFVFEYMYHCYPYIDSILAADDYAKIVNPNSSSSEYYSALWDSTKRVTNILFNKAAVSFASLLYTAWVEAGEPNFDEHTFAAVLLQQQFTLHSVYYGKNDSLLTILFQTDEPMRYNFEIVDLSGKLHYQKSDEKHSAGLYEEVIDCTQFSSGVYMLSLSGNGKRVVERFVVGQ